MTSRQRKFVQLIGKGMIAERAKVLAGYSPKTNADDIRKMAQIAPALARQAEKNGITTELIQTGLLRLAEKSEDGSDMATAVRALEILGRTCGAYAKDHEQAAPATIPTIRIILNDIPTPKQQAQT